MKNAIILPGTSHAVTCTTSTASWANSYDENRGTYWEQGVCGRCGWSSTATHLFSNTFRISYITFYSTAYARIQSRYDGNSSCSSTVQYTTDGGSSWNNLDAALVNSASVTTYDEDKNASQTIDEVEFELPVPVKMNGIRVYGVGSSSCSDPCTNEQSRIRSYDLRAFFQPYGYAQII